MDAKQVRAMFDASDRVKAETHGTACECSACVGECQTCKAVGGLCINCDRHLDALADAYAD